MSDGFFSRWAKRKDAVRRGDEVAPEPTQDPAPAASPQPSPASGRGGLSPQRGAGDARQPLPTIEDTQALTPASDFTRFVQPDVPPDVKNAALKKLFADPHFNRMDGLDVYIDDYNKPDPLPPAMLRQLASAKFLDLFHEEEAPLGDDGGEGTSDRESAEPPAPRSVAQSQARTGDASPPAAQHADPDLRLQQDDAPGAEGPGAGPR